jgi:putative LysE/RhtB family amino acid efflux pump
MSSLSYFYEAFIFGFVISSIIGPIGMLCIKKTLELGLMHGMSVGLGASLADVVCALVVGIGMSAISEFLLGATFYIKLIGGIFLLYLSYNEIKDKAPVKAISSPSKECLKLTFQAFLLTIISPMTLLPFIAIFARIGSADMTFDKVLWMVAGVFVGSTVWWLILCGLILKIKHRMSDKWIYLIRVLSAAVLGLFGAWSIISSFVG